MTVQASTGIFPVFGCPHTEMRSRRAEFEQYVNDNQMHLDLHMKRDAPHYSMGTTRKAFTDWLNAMK